MKKYALLLLFTVAGFSAFAHLPDSIKNGSDFYIIYMDEESRDSLGLKVTVPTLVRGMDIWERTLVKGNANAGPNAWGEEVSYLAWMVDPYSEMQWNGGAIYTDVNAFIDPPDLSPITDNPDDYYFHMAVKSPVEQPDAVWTLIFYSDGSTSVLETGGVRYFVGPQEVVMGATKLGNYAHDGEWHHLELPVSELVKKGYRWDGPLRQWAPETEEGDSIMPLYLLGYQNLTNITGTELNLDALFFYKKPGAPGGTGLPGVAANALSVYPNPAGNTLCIRGLDGAAAARILDLTGKTVWSRVVSEKRIDVSGLARGVYFLKVNDRTVKFIKQ